MIPRRACQSTVLHVNDARQSKPWEGARSEMFNKAGFSCEIELKRETCSLENHRMHIKPPILLVLGH